MVWEIPCQRTLAGQIEASTVSRSFLHHLSESVNHGSAGDLFLPNTGYFIFRLHITIQTIEEIEQR